MRDPRLISVSTPSRAEAVAVVLHGGAARERRPAVRPAQLSVLRMVPVATRLARAGRGRLAVLRLLNSSRGWDSRRNPVDDVRWALAEVGQRFPGLPVALVGHSLGGRAALLGAEESAVRVAVALNAYVYPTDVPDLRGRRLLFVHGDRDRVASAAHAASVARHLGSAPGSDPGSAPGSDPESDPESDPATNAENNTVTTTQVGFISVRGATHAMLRRRLVFERSATDFVAATMLGDDSREPAVQRVLDGERWVTV